MKKCLLFHFFSFIVQRSPYNDFKWVVHSFEVGGQSFRNTLRAATPRSNQFILTVQKSIVVELTNPICT